MVSIYTEDTMSVDTVFATAVERMAEDRGLSMRELAHEVMKLSSPDVSVREFRRVSRPDKKDRLRALTLTEAYEFSRKFGKTIDDMIAIGLLRK